MSFNFLSKNVVGLDIGSKNIKIVFLTPISKNTFKLNKWALLNLPDNIVSADTLPETRNPVVVQTIKNFYSNNIGLSRKVAVSVSGPSVVIRYIKLPIMTKEEIAKSINIEAEPFIPFPISEVNLGFDIIAEVIDEGIKKNEIVLVAVRKEVINSKLDLLKECNLTPKYIDVDVFALETVLKYNYDIQNDVVCIVNIGANITNVSIVEDGVTRVSRDLTLGMEYIRQSIKNIQQIENMTQIDSLIKDHGIILKEEDKEKYLQEDRKTELLFTKNLTAVLKELISELHKIIDFYYFQKGEQKVLSKIYVSGGGSVIKNLCDYLSQEFKLPVELLDPMKKIEAADKIPQELRPIFAVATGLAMRR